MGEDFAAYYHRHFRNVFANELYHFLCQQDMLVFNKLRQGVDHLEADEVYALLGTFGDTVRYFYRKSTLEKQVHSALRVLGTKDAQQEFESLGSEAKKRANVIKEAAKEYFAKGYALRIHP